MPKTDKPLVIRGGAGRMVRVKTPEPVPPTLMALMLASNVPVAVGVPDINPVDELIANPSGNPVASKPVGLLFAVIW